jgi:hypothetical protein
MSKHIGRKQRWTAHGPTRYSSALGQVVYEQRAWYGILEYKTRSDDNPTPDWTAHTKRLGPFKRPRNAMVALEEEATILRNRHGDNLQIHAAGGGFVL